MLNHTIPELVEKAQARYFRDCERSFAVYCQPSNHGWDVAGDLVTLWNCNGVLAQYRYRVDRRGAVRFRSA